MGRMLRFIILLLHNNGYGCSLRQVWCRLYPHRIVGCRCLSKCHAADGSLGHTCVRDAHSFLAYSIITPVRGKWASDIKCSTHNCSYRVLSVTATPPIQTFKGRWLIIFNHYRRGVESIVASSKEEVAHPHLVIVGFDSMG